MLESTQQNVVSAHQFFYTTKGNPKRATDRLLLHYCGDKRLCTRCRRGVQWTPVSQRDALIAVPKTVGYTCIAQSAQRVAPITMTANPNTESTKLRLPFHHMTGNKYDARSKNYRRKRTEDTFFPNYRTQVRSEWMKTRTFSFDPGKYRRKQKYGDPS